MRTVPGFVTVEDQPRSLMARRRLPGSLQAKVHLTVGERCGERVAASSEDQVIVPAACFWYDWFYAPVACGFVDFNERYGIGGYGRSPCAAWQIPFDPVGCALLPRSRNRF